MCGKAGWKIRFKVQGFKDQAVNPLTVNPEPYVSAKPIETQQEIWYCSGKKRKDNTHDKIF
jgi:hypothetical protein